VFHSFPVRGVEVQRNFPTRFGWAVGGPGQPAKIFDESLNRNSSYRGRHAALRKMSIVQGAGLQILAPKAKTCLP
jgi:hypothetical protein